MTHIFPFTQSWLPEPEFNCHSGTASITIKEGELHLHVQLTQPRVHTKATAHQQRLWELGDVVELFIQQVGASDYYEYQIAPNGMMLALHYPERLAVTAVRNGERKMEEFLCDLPIKGTSTLIQTGWEPSLLIPISGNQLRINCGRYDYSSGDTPVISSISALTKRDFHRVEEWRVIN